MQKILVLGATGMIGSAIFRTLSVDNHFHVFGSIRSTALKSHFSVKQQKHLVICGNILDDDQLIRLFASVRPNILINCIGLTKHHLEAGDPLLSIPLNSLLPHRLADICSISGARLIHISTDCVFSGLSGGYREGDVSDALDIYGKSKFLGEVVDRSHAVTLRTSTIGHELQGKYGLLEWFLSQKKSCLGYSRAIFSGLPSTVFAEVIRDYVLPRTDLHGLYHVGASPIGKYDLLKLIAAKYSVQINISRDESFSIDRSLNVDRFRSETGYFAPSWPELIDSMNLSREVF